MRIALFLILLLLMTPISCRAEIRHEHGVRFRLRLRIWGIPLCIDHSQTPLRPKAPSPRQLRAGQQLLRVLPKLKRPLGLLMRQTTLESLCLHLSLSLRDPAATALGSALLAQLRLLLPKRCRERVRIAVTPDFLHDQSFWAARCIIFLRLGTILVAAAMALTAWKEATSWNIPSAS